MAGLLFNAGSLTEESGLKKEADSLMVADSKSAFRATSSLEKCIGGLHSNMGIHFVTNGRWDMSDLLFYILEQTGPARVSFCTWQINEDAVRKLLQACENGLITQLNALLDRRIKVRRESVLEFIKQFSSRISHSADCHAKVLAISGQSVQVSVVASANMTSNRRIEAGYLSTHPRACTFHQEWIINQIEENDPFE